MTHHTLHYVTQYILILRESLMCTCDTCISLLQISIYYYHHRFHCEVHLAFAIVQSATRWRAPFFECSLHLVFQFLPVHACIVSWLWFKLKLWPLLSVQLFCYLLQFSSLSVNIWSFPWVYFFLSAMTHEVVIIPVLHLYFWILVIMQS